MNTSVPVPHPNSLAIKNSGFPAPPTPAPKSLGPQLPPLRDTSSPSNKESQIPSSPGYSSPGLQPHSLLRTQESGPSASSSFTHPEILALLFMTQASPLGRAGSWIRNAVISRPLPAPLLGCPPPGPQLPSQSVFRLVGTAGTGSLGLSAGGDYDIQPRRPGRELG